MIEKLKNIQVLVMDVDGVLTDGKIVFDSNGNELKFFCVKDGFGLTRWHHLGKKSAIITARYSKPVAMRADGLKIDRVYQDAYPKMGYYEKVLSEFGVDDEQVCYVGDDLADIPVIKRVGIGIAVRNAVPEAKAAADYVTEHCGGDGAVREMIEMILKAQGLWRSE